MADLNTISSDHRLEHNLDLISSKLDVLDLALNTYGSSHDTFYNLFNPSVGYQKIHYDSFATIDNITFKSVGIGYDTTSRYIQSVASNEYIEIDIIADYPITLSEFYIQVDTRGYDDNFSIEYSVDGKNTWVAGQVGLNTVEYKELSIKITFLTEGKLYSLGVLYDKLQVDSFAEPRKRESYSFISNLAISTQITVPNNVSYVPNNKQLSVWYIPDLTTEGSRLLIPDVDYTEIDEFTIELLREFIAPATLYFIVDFDLFRVQPDELKWFTELNTWIPVDSNSIYVDASLQPTNYLGRSIRINYDNGDTSYHHVLSLDSVDSYYGLTKLTLDSGLNSNSYLSSLNYCLTVTPQIHYADTKIRSTDNWELTFGLTHNSIPNSTQSVLADFNGTAQLKLTYEGTITDPDTLVLTDGITDISLPQRIFPSILYQVKLVKNSDNYEIFINNVSESSGTLVEFDINNLSLGSSNLDTNLADAQLCDFTFKDINWNILFYAPDKDITELGIVDLSYGISPNLAPYNPNFLDRIIALESELNLVNNKLDNVAAKEHNDLEGRSIQGSHPTTAISTDTTNFNNSLSSSDITVQQALEALDDADLTPTQKEAATQYASETEVGLVSITAQAFAGDKTFVDNVTVNGDFAVDSIKQLGETAGSGNVLAEFIGDFESGVNRNILAIQSTRFADVVNDNPWSNSAIKLLASVDKNSVLNSWIEFRRGSTTTDNSIAFGEGENQPWGVFNNGKFGLGISSPNAMFHVVENGSSAAKFIGERDGKRVLIGASSTGGYLSAQDTLGNALPVQIFVGSNIALQADTDNSIRMPFVYSDTVTSAKSLYIQSNGKIGELSSSERYKRDIVPLNDVSYLNEIKCVQFVYKDDDTNTVQNGVIAEQLDSIADLKQFVSYDRDGQPNAVAYEKMIIPIVKYVQQLNQKIEALENEK